MSCDGCAELIERALRRETQVEEFRYDLKRRAVAVLLRAVPSDADRVAHLVSSAGPFTPRRIRSQA